MVGKPVKFFTTTAIRHNNRKNEKYSDLCICRTDLNIFGPGNLLVSSSQDGVVKLWQISKGGEGSKCLRTLRGYARLIESIAFSPDGKFLVSDESNGTVRWWETKSRQCLRVFFKQASEYSALTFSPDGRFFAQGLVEIWCAPSPAALAGQDLLSSVPTNVCSFHARKKAYFSSLMLT